MDSIAQPNHHPLGSNLSKYLFSSLGISRLCSVLKLQVYFELSYKNTLKLAFIGIFMSLSAMTKVLLGSVLLVIIGYYMPALVFFVGIWYVAFSLLVIYWSLFMKVFTKNWPTNKTKQFRLHSLLRIYILVSDCCHFQLCPYAFICRLGWA